LLFFANQDGSCNGLQHYAALGRDVLGGRSVNVLPSPKPQDVYSEIAAIVEQKRADDEKKGKNTIRLVNSARVNP
jgi:DNA-directed RNA polymerase